MKSVETFTEVYNRYAALIMKSVMAQTQSREVAEEICQNVFLSYYKHMEKVDESFVKAWLLHVANNQVIDFWRKNGSQGKCDSEVSMEALSEKKDENDVVKRYTERRFISEIMENLREKNPNWYDVIDCICVQQMTLEEASKFLGVPERDLKSRLYRARKYIRKMFEKER